MIPPFLKYLLFYQALPFYGKNPAPSFIKGGEAYKGRGLKTMITHEQIMSNEIPSVGFR